MRSGMAALFCSALTFCAGASAETFTIASEIPFRTRIPVQERVKMECGLQTSLPEYIRDAAEGDVEIVISDAPLDDATGKVLRLQFTTVLVPGVTVSGELWENGEMIGSFVASRQTMSRGSDCDILVVCTRRVGSDIALWLLSPRMNTRLG